MSHVLIAASAVIQILVPTQSRGPLCIVHDKTNMVFPRKMHFCLAISAHGWAIEQNWH